MAGKKRSVAWQCCYNCKYLRWSKEEQWTANPVELETAREKLQKLLDAGMPYSMAYEEAFEPVWYFPNGEPRCFGEETGEYRGIPVCDLGEVDFNDELGITFEVPYDPENPGAPSTRRDGRMRRWMEEEYGRITDPAARAEFIRRNHNGEILKGERSTDELPELGHQLEIDPDEDFPYQRPTVPNYRVSGSAGGRQNFTTYQIFIDQGRYIRQYLFENGCEYGVYKDTYGTYSFLSGRRFDSWMSKERRQEVREVALDKAKKQLAANMDFILGIPVPAQDNQQLIEEIAIKERKADLSSIMDNILLVGHHIA